MTTYLDKVLSTLPVDDARQTARHCLQGDSPEGLDLFDVYTGDTTLCRRSVGQTFAAGRGSGVGLVSTPIVDTTHHACMRKLTVVVTQLACTTIEARINYQTCEAQETTKAPPREG